MAMADDKLKVEQQLITEIESVYVELFKRKVIPEKVDLKSFSVEELEMELTAVSEQLATRKRFLGMDTTDAKKDKEVVDEVVELYADGGVILKNPSNVGGLWAWCGVNAKGERVIEKSGAIPAGEGRTISNNHTEQIAITLALEAMPDGWSGTVYSDSMIALGRIFKNWSERNLPRNVSMRSKAAVARLGEIKTVLLQGHPTKADLACGIGKKRGLPVSEHNCWCDKACGKAAKEYLENLEIG
jgi:ribonuclease HI